jgi:hypothetical protein
MLVKEPHNADLTECAAKKKSAFKQPPKYLRRFLIVIFLFMEFLITIFNEFYLPILFMEFIKEV